MKNILASFVGRSLLLARTHASFQVKQARAGESSSSGMATVALQALSGARETGRNEHLGADVALYCLLGTIRHIAMETLTVSLTAVYLFYLSFLFFILYFKKHLKNICFK